VLKSIRITAWPAMDLMPFSVRAAPDGHSGIEIAGTVSDLPLFLWHRVSGTALAGRAARMRPLYGWQ